MRVEEKLIRGVRIVSTSVLALYAAGTDLVL